MSDRPIETGLKRELLDLMYERRHTFDSLADVLKTPKSTVYRQLATPGCRVPVDTYREIADALGARLTVVVTAADGTVYAPTGVAGAGAILAAVDGMEEARLAAVTQIAVKARSVPLAVLEAMVTTLSAFDRK